ncbi:MAG: hypothetical protein Q8Q02_09135 [Nocardioides sp.]|nr:hypothetical protein [Nocardioides sp.]
MTTNLRGFRFRRSVLFGGVVVLLVLAAGAYFGFMRTGAAPESGPMRLPQGLGMAMAPATTGMFATVAGCSRSEPVQITIRQIEALNLEGTDSVEFRVAWPNEENPATIAAGPLPPPSMYGGPEGATGTLVTCRSHLERYVDIAVLLPRATTEPVFVHGLAVTYEVGGETFRAVADATLGICVEKTPPGTSPPEGCNMD